MESIQNEKKFKSFGDINKEPGDMVLGEKENFILK